jgi:hypothetical protein
MTLEEWIEQHSSPAFEWYLKRLSGNDTQATGGHQAGPYLPKSMVFRLFPEFESATDLNPRASVLLRAVQTGFVSDGSVIYYNNRRIQRGGTRDETRLTGLGGMSSPLLNPDNTGAIAIFAYQPGDLREWQYWVCASAAEEAFVEDVVGPVEPGEALFWSVASGRTRLSRGVAERNTCRLAADEIPPDWLTRFPRGAEIIAKAIELRSSSGMGPDDRILKRRECEFEVFQSVEEAFFGPKIGNGFDGIEPFLGLAQTILQSRKSRAGKSLEYHVKALLDEEGFAAGTQYAYNAEIEGGKRPDFLFPSLEAYRDESFPASGLAMLAVKTTCKDRWRQILNEADRIPLKHLLTVQEGVSESQFREITNAGVKLVVPHKLHEKYPQTVRSELMTVESFLAQVSSL